MAAATASRTLLRSLLDPYPTPSRLTVLPCGPRSAKIHASSHPFGDVFPVSPGGVLEKTLVVAVAVHDLLLDR